MTRLAWVPFVPLLAVTSLFSISQETDLTGRVWVRPLAGQTWLVRSVSNLEGFGPVESNAVLIAGDRDSVLIDTPATNEQTALVLDWAATQLERPVRGLIVTHWHQDRMGGINVAVKRGIPTYGFGKTIKMARRNHLTAPEYKLRSHEHLILSGISLETFYPGPGHTDDNLVVWIPRDQVLDGGCFVKASDSGSLGNVQEINTVTWSEGMAAVRHRYGSAAIVVPGHGTPGGPELLDHTATLLYSSLH